MDIVPRFSTTNAPAPVGPKPRAGATWLCVALFCSMLGWSAAVWAADRPDAVSPPSHDAVDSAPRLPLPSEPPPPAVDARAVWFVSAGVVVALVVGGVLFVHRREHSLRHAPAART